MNQNVQALILTGVAVTVGVVAFQRPTVATPVANALPELMVASPEVEAPRINDSLASARAAIADVTVALPTGRSAGMDPGDLERQELARAAQARRAAVVERARAEREMERARSAKEFDVRIAAMEEENAALVQEAIKKENKAIAISHATVDRRNRQQWNLLSDFLATTIINPKPPSPL